DAVALAVIMWPAVLAVVEKPLPQRDALRDGRDVIPRFDHYYAGVGPETRELVGDQRRADAGADDAYVALDDVALGEEDHGRAAWSFRAERGICTSKCRSLAAL